MNAKKEGKALLKTTRFYHLLPRGDDSCKYDAPICVLELELLFGSLNSRVVYSVKDVSFCVRGTHRA